MHLNKPLFMVLKIQIDLLLFFKYAMHSLQSLSNRNYYLQKNIDTGLVSDLSIWEYKKKECDISR